MIEKRNPRLGPIEKICLAEKHDVPRWLAPAFESLCQRNHPLEIHEAEKIGVRYTTLLARAREEVRCVAQKNIRWGSPKDTLPYDTSDVARIVQEVFFPSQPIQ